MTPIQIVPPDTIPKAEEVPLDNLLPVFRLCTQMEKFCVENEGIGLSAVQVGVPWKLFVVLREDHFEYYVNCEYHGIEGGKEKSKSIEGCLSLRDKDGNLRRFEVDRFPVVLVKGKELKVGDDPCLSIQDINKLESGLMSVVFQHEIDHQNGVLISNIGKEIEVYA